jgi:hypothetical protein
MANANVAQPARPEQTAAFAEDSPLETAYFTFQEMGLPLPPLPGAFLDGLQQMADHVFSTRADLVSLTGLEVLVDAAVRGTAAPYAAFGYEGHGTNSWHLRYCLVVPNLAIFIELPFGGAYGDALADRAEIVAAFSQVERLLAALDSPARKGASNAPRRSIVEHRGFRSSRWAEVTSAGGQPVWHETRRPLADLLTVLSR